MRLALKLPQRESIAILINMYMELFISLSSLLSSLSPLSTHHLTVLIPLSVQILDLSLFTVDEVGERAAIVLVDLADL